MKSSIFTKEFFTQTKANTKPKNARTIKDMIINGRIFRYDPIYKEYVDSELAGFLKKFPDEEDYWEFSGNGFDIWFAGTFAEVKSDLEEYWEPEPLDRIELILLRLWKEFRSIKVGDLVCQIGQQPQKVISLHPEIEGQEEAFSCRSQNGEIRRVSFKDWRDGMWEIEYKASDR